MTESELLESMNMTVANGLAAYAIFLTLASSYIVSAHLAGQTLSRSQIGLLSFFYTISMVVMIFTLHGHAALADSLRAEQILNFPRGGERAYGVATLSLISNVFIYLGTLKYMWDVRKNGATG